MGWLSFELELRSEENNLTKAVMRNVTLEVSHKVRTREDCSPKNLNWCFFKLTQSEDTRINVGH